MSVIQHIDEAIVSLQTALDNYGTSAAASLIAGTIELLGGESPQAAISLSDLQDLARERMDDATWLLISTDIIQGMKNSKFRYQKNTNISTTIDRILDEIFPWADYVIIEEDKNV